MDRSCFRPLVCIAPIQPSESTNLHLVVAVTGFGVRLYWPSYDEATPSRRPVTLQLVQVRLSPGYAVKNASLHRPHQQHSDCRPGTTLLASSTAPDNDVVCWTLSSSSFPAAQQLSETENLLGLDGKTWALVVEVTPKRSCSAGFPAFAPEHLIIVTQHWAGPKTFNIFLTTQCCHVVTQLRPVDILRQLLFDASGPDSTAVRAFFQVLREDHSFATALILACSTSVQDFQLADWAARAFFLHGGDVKIVPGAVKSPASSFINLNTTAGLQQSYSTFTSPVAGGFNPNAISTPQISAPSSDSTEFKFSGRHNDL